MNNKFRAIQVEELEGGALWRLQINNPPVNLLTIKIIDEIAGCIDLFGQSRQARVLVFTSGLEKFFIAGADPEEINSISSPEDGFVTAKRGQDLCSKIAALEKPVIAAIDGACIGGGNEIAIACHMRIASDKAVFQQPEIHLGIIPAFGGTQRLGRLIGESRAKKMILTGEKISAKDALLFGLIDQLVSERSALDESLRIARVMLSKSPTAIKLAFKALNKGAALSLSDGLAIELECFREVCKNSNMKEALNAFKERRRPIFEP